MPSKAQQRPEQVVKVLSINTRFEPKSPRWRVDGALCCQCGCNIDVEKVNKEDDIINETEYSYNSYCNKSDDSINKKS